MTSMSYRGPTLFNALPRYVRDKECSSVDQFKRVLDRFLTSVPDQPKIPHYSIRALSNSIPDQLALMRADGNFMDSPPHDTLYPVPFTGEGNNSAIKEKTNKRRGKLCELGNYNKRAPTRVVTQRMTSMSYRGPTLFNALPRYVRDKECSSVDQFKRVLDRFLTSVPDQPKIPHYSIRALSNSIPDQLALMRADGNFMDSPPHDTLYPVPFTGEG
ncbi:hypothetical protein Pcinc_000193 [Petrolisthes cinctipes]|uniref:Uncharacterized protein n=1 Tax=Petrolisthes cinctipes TaxID=88211 RepID=A0AAE1L6M1_PETCI|nr:hypothetical protein Pcinc_000193 [Petrolisthes cinctipes]